MRKLKKGYVTIRQRMRECERELLDHLREYEVSMTDRFSRSWHNTLDRLMEAGMVRYQKPTKHRIGRYVAVKGARPVTVVPKTKSKKVSRKRPVGSSGRRPFSPRSYTKRGHLRKSVVWGPVVCRLRVKTNGAGAFEMANVRSRTRQWTEIGMPCPTVPMRTNVDRTGTDLNHPCLPQQGLGAILQGRLMPSNRALRRLGGAWFPTGGAQ